MFELRLFLIKLCKEHLVIKSMENLQSTTLIYMKYEWTILNKWPDKKKKQIQDLTNLKVYKTFKNILDISLEWKNLHKLCIKAWKLL